MRKWITACALLLVMYLLETTLLQGLSIAGAVPNLIIILLVVISFRYGQVNGLIFGFVAGLFTDLMDGTYLGLFALLYMSLGYLLGFANKIYDKDDYTIPLILTGLTDILYNFGIFIVGFLLRNRTHLLFYLRSIVLPEAIYTVVVSVLLYRAIQKLFILLEPKETEKEVTGD